MTRAAPDAPTVGGRFRFTARAWPVSYPEAEFSLVSAAPRIRRSTIICSDDGGGACAATAFAAARIASVVVVGVAGGSGVAGCGAGRGRSSSSNGRRRGLRPFLRGMSNQPFVIIDRRTTVSAPLAQQKLCADRPPVRQRDEQHDEHDDDDQERDRVDSENR